MDPELVRAVQEGRYVVCGATLAEALLRAALEADDEDLAVVLTAPRRKGDRG